MDLLRRALYAGLLLLMPVQQPPAPPPPPDFAGATQDPSWQHAHVHGPHENEAGARCYQGEDRDLLTDEETRRRLGLETNIHLYHCECKMMCVQGAGGEQIRQEDDACQTACNGRNQCLCHEDESCINPMDMAPPDPLDDPALRPDRAHSPGRR